MKLTEKINKIIDQRKGTGEYAGRGHLRCVESQINNFNDILYILNGSSEALGFYNFRARVLSQIEDQAGEYYDMSIEDPTFKDRVLATSPDKLMSLLNQGIEECNRLYDRFNRDTVNLSVIGRAGQGKSTLLQSISGLEDSIIPAASGGDCTGAKSVICNQKGVVHAKIIFYTQDELKEQVQRYIDNIGVSKRLHSVMSIGSLDLDSIEKTMQSGTQALSRFKHLKKYVEYFSEYYNNLGTTKEIGKDDIRLYVAQYDINNNPVYNYLAVKEVQIFTPFNYEDAGNIMLVDTIGLGDTSIGIKDKMMETIINDSDAAIILRRPDKLRDDIREEDNQLVDAIKEQTEGRSLEKWLFYVLNVSAGLENKHTGKIFQESLFDQMKKGSLKVASIEQIDCSNQGDVESKLLIPVLEALSENLSDIDNDLMIHANDLFSKIYCEYFAFCQKVQQVINSHFKKDIGAGEIFDREFDQLSLSNKLFELNNKYAAVKDKKCSEINDAIYKVLTTMTDTLPDYDDILKRLLGGGGDARFHNVYNYYVDVTRPRIADQFELINSNTITILQDNLKREIAEILYSENSGRLSFIKFAGSDDTDSILDWLDLFTKEKLSKTSYPLLNSAFRYIIDYRLNIEGLLEYKVDRCLECLEPGSAKFVEPRDIKGTMEEKAQYIDQSIRGSINVVAEELIGSVSEFLSIPYNSFYARIRKFREKIIYSEEGRKELRNFYRDNCSTIWRDSFSNAAKAVAACGLWNDYKDKFEGKCNKNMFNIKVK